jgi:hypothetical protein
MGRMWITLLPWHTLRISGTWLVRKGWRGYTAENCTSDRSYNENTLHLITSLRLCDADGRRSITPRRPNDGFDCRQG